MFEQPAAKSDKDRSKAIMILSGVAVLIVIVLIVMVTSFSTRQSETDIARAGTPEFDDYTSSVEINSVNKRSGERLNARYARILCTVRNAGNREIIALQLRAAVIGTGGQLIREKIITPVPNTKSTLPPNQSMNIDVSLEPVPDPSEIMDMTIDVYGLKIR